jgi:hypothetical protein
VMFAVVLGVATTALAAVPGDPFVLGKINAVNAISRLAGSVTGPSLQIENDSANASATALDLRVRPGRPPMKVNSSVEVHGLNVDSLDGKNSSDFLPSRTYEKDGALVTLGANETGFATADCDAGDVALSGGYVVGFGASSTVFSVNTSDGRSSVGFKGPRAVIASVTCADFPPLRP